MQKLYTILFAMVLVSCGKISPKGDIEQKQIPLQEYTSIDAEGKFRIFWVKSPQNILEIETYPNFIENLNINQEGKTLSIKEKRETQGLGFYNLTIFSEYHPKQIILSDSVEMNISGKIKTDDLVLKMNKNAKFIGSIHTKKISVEMQNHSLANFQGFTENIHLSMKDTAQVVAPYLFVDVLDINAQNGSFAEFSIKDTIKGNLKNTSKLWYYDNPIFKAKREKSTEIKQETR